MLIKTNKSGTILAWKDEGTLWQSALEDSSKIDWVEVEAPAGFRYDCTIFRYRNGKIEVDEKARAAAEEERELSDLRDMREQECFRIINRGEVWYSLLNDDQKKELQEWYEAWLDVTDTRKVPVRPSWVR